MKRTGFVLLAALNAASTRVQILFGFERDDLGNAPDVLFGEMRAIPLEEEVL
jgi:hypothetical protein